MNILVVGDVHSCYYTFKALVKKAWNPDCEFLIQVGDLINKGPHAARTVSYVRKLQMKYPYQVFILKGNHEDRYLMYHDKPGMSKSIAQTRADFVKNEINLKAVNKWLKSLPYKWENPNLLITHAGISKSVKNPYRSSNPRGVLHNRSALRNVGKLQVYGHMIQLNGQIKYDPGAHAWCIDSGCWLGNGLSALRIRDTGEVLEKIKQKTKAKDLVQR
jgi:serine/threonine protein phosphatase 1